VINTMTRRVIPMKFNESLEPLLFVHLFNNGVRVFMAPLSSADAQHVTNSN